MCCGNWLWKNYDNFDSLSRQACTPRPGCNKKLFYLWRVLACLIAFGNAVHIASAYGAVLDLFYWTDWGVFTTGLTFLVLLIDTMFNANKTDQQFEEEAENRSKNSPFWMYKWAISIFQTALIIEVNITFLFWCFLMPIFYLYTKETSVCGIINAVAPGECGTWIFDHAALIILLLIDWWFNMIRIDARHYLITCIVGVIYLPFNFIGYCVLKYPIYPGMDWFNTPKAGFLVFLGGFVVLTLSFLLMKCLTDLKFKRIDRQEAERFASVADETNLESQTDYQKMSEEQQQKQETA